MRRQILPVLSCCVLFAGSAVYASPGHNDDLLGSFLNDKGLLQRMESAGAAMSNKAADLVVTSLGFLGVPYQRGGNTVESGFDCSGFVKSMFEQTVGLILPRRAEQQAASTQTIERAELQPGDLVFFNTMRRAFSHVGIYVGDGKFIHSPKPGKAVRIDSMSETYWARRFDGARRVDPQAVGTSGTSFTPIPR